MPDDIYRFSEAPLWDAQREIFEQRGIDIWSTSSLPDYSTNNPVVAYHYARMALAFLIDWSRLNPENTERVYIVELGAGTGLLAFNFLKAFTPLVRDYPLELPPYTYVITDFTEPIVSFSQAHPRLQPYVQRGLLDFAIFDADVTETLELRYSGRTIQPDGLVSIETPLFLIANYFFDTIRQDLFHFSKKKAQDVYIQPQPVETLWSKDGKVQEQVHTPHYVKMREAPYADKTLNAIFEDYRATLTGAHVLIPHIGIDCLNRLSRLSTAGFALLSMDRGYALASQLNNLPAPTFTSVSSAFYLTVNYHAILTYFESAGAKSLTSTHRHPNLTTVGLLAVPNVDAYAVTRPTFMDVIDAYGPDDIFEVSRVLEAQYDSLSLEQVKAVLRLNRYDPRIFMRLGRRLTEVVVDEPEERVQELLDMIPLVENMYYSIGEPEHLSFFIAQLLLAVEQVEQARARFQHAEAEGMHTDMLFFNLALTEARLGNYRQAKSLLAKVFAINPTHEPALELQDYLAKYTLFG